MDNEHNKGQRITDAKRCSDEELVEFYSEFKSHQSEEVELSKRLLECQEDLREAVDSLSDIVHENSKSTDRLYIKTKDMVEVWDDAKGAIHVISWAGKFLKWTGGIAIIYFAIVEAIKHTSK